MLRTSSILKIICLFAFCYSISIPIKKAWNFELISIFANSSDESRFKFDVKLKRISRGIYGIRGKVYFYFDIKDGDDSMIEAMTYRSLTGSSEYMPVPFRMKKQHIHDFLNTFYKDLFMKSVANCSNLIQFKDKFQPPVEKKIYELNNCRVSNEGLPPIMAVGYYKIVVIGSGQIDYTAAVIAKVELDI